MVANAIHISDQFESNGASKDEFSQHDTQWTIGSALGQLSRFQVFQFSLKIFFVRPEAERERHSFSLCSM